MKQYYVMDMGGTFVKYALMNENYEILEQGKYPSITSDLDSFLKSVDENIEKYKGQFEGIAVSLPGRIDTKTGIAHNGGAFAFFQDTPFAQILEEKYGVPVTLGNDGKCAAKAEAEKGALKDVSNGAVMIIGTGIGGGIVLDHKVLMGTQAAAGEFSYIVSDFEGFTKGSFKDFSAFEYTWSSTCSSLGLMRDYASRKGEDPSKYNGVTFFEAYDNGDPDAIAALDHFGKLVASGIFCLQSILDLQRVAIGGGISARKEVTDAVRENLIPHFDMPFIPFGVPEIVTCEFGNDANLLGALGFHLERI